MSLQNTLAKFGYPDSLISENEHWYTLLRLEQITFSSMILICKNKKNSSFSKLIKSEQTEMFRAIQHIEKVALSKIGCDRINYLALMMVDPFVHYHVLPRYKNPKIFKDIEFIDPGYPGVPDLTYKTSLTETEFSKLVAYLKGLFFGT